MRLLLATGTRTPLYRASRCHRARWVLVCAKLPHLIVTEALKCFFRVAAATFASSFCHRVGNSFGGQYVLWTAHHLSKPDRQVFLGVGWGACRCQSSTASFGPSYAASGCWSGPASSCSVSDSCVGVPTESTGGSRRGVAEIPSDSVSEVHCQQFLSYLSDAHALNTLMAQATRRPNLPRTSPGAGRAWLTGGPASSIYVWDPSHTSQPVSHPRPPPSFSSASASGGARSVSTPGGCRQVCSSAKDRCKLPSSAAWEASSASPSRMTPGSTLRFRSRKVAWALGNCLPLTSRLPDLHNNLWDSHSAVQRHTRP